MNPENELVNESAENLPDPVFKEVTRQEAEQVGIEAIETEFQHSLRADLVLKVPPNTNLEGTMFDFFRPFNVVEFKSRNDFFDLAEFAKTEARSRLLIIQKIGATYDNTAVVIVCAREPKGVLSYIKKRNYKVVTSEERPWLIEAQVGLVQTFFVICHKLPFEKRYYSWLMFTSPDNKRWPELIKKLLEQNASTTLRRIYELYPKEFAMFQISDERMLELINSRGPKSRKKYKQDWLEAIQMLVQDWRKHGDLEEIEGLGKTLTPEEYTASLDQEKRQQLLKLLLEQEKQSQLKEETNEKKAEE